MFLQTVGYTAAAVLAAVAALLATESYVKGLHSRLVRMRLGIEALNGLPLSADDKFVAPGAMYWVITVHEHQLIYTPVVVITVRYAGLVEVVDESRKTTYVNPRSLYALSHTGKTPAEAGHRIPAAVEELSEEEGYSASND